MRRHPGSAPRRGGHQRMRRAECGHGSGWAVTSGLVAGCRRRGFVAGCRRASPDLKRMKRQRHVDDLAVEVERLRRENEAI